MPVVECEQNLAALDNLTCTREELDEIDEYAVEGNVNLWQASSSA